MSKIFGMNQNNSKVILNIYDLHESNDIFHSLGFGLFHSGVQIGREEYTFGSGSGIFSHEPQQVPNAKLRESIEMGDFKGTSRDISNTVSDLRQIFRGSDYHILTKNCNSFSDEFLKRLIGKEIPGYVNRLAFVGNMFSCLLPPQLLNSAPVDGPANSNSGTNNAARTFHTTPGNSINNKSNSSSNGQYIVSQGVKLGSSNPSQQQPSSIPIDSIQAREEMRELKRKAALSRMKV